MSPGNSSRRVLDSNQSHSIKPTGLNFFARPALETTKEIGAAFQYHPPPTRTRTQSSTLPQIDLARSYLSNNEDIESQSSTNSGTIDHEGPERPAAPAPLRGIDQGNVQLKPRSHTLNTPKSSQPVLGSASGLHNSMWPNSTSDEHLDSLPFPQSSNSPSTNRNKSTVPFSASTKAQLPKPFSDTRRKALAQMSPRNRSPQAKHLLSPSEDMRRQSTKASNPSRSKGSGRVQHPLADSLAQSSDGTMPDAQIEEAEPVLGKKHHSRREVTQKATMPPRDSMVFEGEVTRSNRPVSQASNISRPRAPEATHPRQTPTRDQYERNREELSIAWNANMCFDKKLIDNWERKMATQEQEIAKRESIIEQCQEEIQSRDQDIAKLSAQNNELHEQNQKVQDAVTTSAIERKKLEDKLRTYKNHLNEAASEHQQLYREMRDKCENTTAEVRSEGQVQKQLIEESDAVYKRVAAEIDQKIESVVREKDKYMEDSNNTIRCLELQLREREKELEREKQRVEDLDKQLVESHELNEQSLQSVVAQNQELFEKMEQDRKQVANTDTKIQKQDEKIDLILKAVEEFKSKQADPIGKTDDLREAHDNLVNAISIEMQNSMESTRGFITEDLGEIHQICQDTYERTVDTNEAAMWKEKADQATMEAQSNAEMTRGLQDELQQADVAMDHQMEENQELERQLHLFRTTAERNERSRTERIRGLIEEVASLEKALGEKDMEITGSSQSLEIIQEELQTQAHSLQEKETQIRDEHKKHEEAVRMILHEQKERISDSVIEKTTEARKKVQDLQKQLQEADGTRTQLEQELTRARQESEANIGEFNRAWSEMRTVIKRGTGLEKSTQALQKALEDVLHDRAGINEMRQSLEQLKKNQPDAIRMSDQLREFMEMQKRLEDDSEFSQTQVDSAEVMSTPGQNPESNTATQSEHSSQPADISQDNMAQLRMLQNRKRKVVVKSPVTDDDRAPPISIEEEKVTRRLAGPQRGIIKIVTRSMSKELEARAQEEPDQTAADRSYQALVSPPQQGQKRKIARRGSKTTPSTHSTYNRPVVGSASETGNGPTDGSQANPRRHGSTITFNIVPSRSGNSNKTEASAYDIPENSDDDKSRIKRQRSLGVEKQDQKSRTSQTSRLSRSKSEYFPMRESEDVEPNEDFSSQPRSVMQRGLSDSSMAPKGN
ncbi:hypothetical protein M426DRAFT_15625 [Hypoxylon sp. CI-4A]|nr:hypothetical protein M426DRAFT_15625 [Hypoxylon sp. CI-4A]